MRGMGSLILFWFMLMLNSCASSPKMGRANVNFVTAKSILNKYKTQDQVSKALGKPSEVLVRSKNELWNYNEPGTGYQRLTLTFSEAKELEAVFWIPRSNEPESELGNVFSHYPASRFSPVRTQEVSPPHSLNTETIYSDNKSMAVLYNDYAKRVEAINWYIEDLRHPAADLKRLSKKEDIRCRQTNEFKKMCELCQADKNLSKTNCAADMPNHGSSPEFVKLAHAIDDMQKACGFSVPAEATVVGFLARLPAICRNEERMPDIHSLIKKSN